MNAKLFASLVEAIEKWSSDACETVEWDRLAPAWSENADLHMAQAAAAVFDAMIETQKEIEAEA